MGLIHEDAPACEGADELVGYGEDRSADRGKFLPTSAGFSMLPRDHVTPRRYDLESKAWALVGRARQGLVIPPKDPSPLDERGSLQHRDRGSPSLPSPSCPLDRAR